MGVSFKETIGLAADIAATGKTGDELLGSIKETTRLAVLGEVDRQEAMKATLAIQSAFKQNTDELSESINFLNAVENQTSTTLNDLVEAIPKAGPVIQGLGGSVQDLALYLTAMREGGINASEGANALKSALASLINPTDVAVGKFQSLGIDLLGIVNNNAGNLTGTLMALQGALDNLDPLQKQQAIEQLFGKFQFSRLNALFENLGRQGSQTLQVLDLMKASTGELASVADRELAAVTESASGKYRRAIESLRASLAEVGEQFLTINTVLIQVIDKIVQFANNLPGPVKQILALAGGFTAIIGPVIMLTGVLANFFGYLLKGAFHMKAFFKGGEGWKYLTPEMLAAEKAGRLVEQSFYSDAKAAAVLQQALRNLLDEFALLEAKAKSGAMSVNPAVSTMAGNLVVGAGGPRVVNPNHPLAGAQGTRASSHMVPRSGMSEAQRLQQTMFGMVPGSIPVNQKIGQNPQIYMNEQLPNVPGLTTVGGVSTGVVASEAARHHAMIAALGMQSKAEIESLKKTIIATGTVNKEFMMTFDDILPIVSRLTDNAARESAMIVAELRAGKLTVEAARAKIIALNLQTEQMISSSMQTAAVGMGRTLNPTIVPTLNQPVVDATGKSNMRELFKKGKTRDFINRIAGVLGVRTSGAGYNIETTVPKKFNRGNIVPGSGNTDTVPAMLTPGEFVVNKEATQKNRPLLEAINSSTQGGQATMGRGNYGKTAAMADYNSGDLDMLYDYLDNLTDGDAYQERFRQNSILNDATALLSSGKAKDIDDAINIARRDVDNALRLSQGDEILYRQIRDVQSRKRGMNTGVIGQRAGTDAKVRDSVSRALANRGYTQIQPFADRAHLSSVAYTETNRGYYGQAAHDRWNRFSNTLSQRIPEIPDRVPVSGASAMLRADMIAKTLGFDDYDDMLIRRGDVNEIAKTGRAPRGKTAPIGIFRFIRGGAEAAVSVASRGRIRMNAGGMVPSQNGQKYNRGGMVPGVQYMQRGGFLKGMLGGAAIGMGGQMLGNSIGGGPGTAISYGSSILGSMIGFGGIGSRGDQKGPGFMGRQMEKIDPKGTLTKPIGPLNSLSTASKGLAGNLGGIAKIFGPVLRGFSTLLKLTSPLGIALTGLTAVVGFFIKSQKEKAAALETGRLAYGLDADAAEKAGFKYTDYNAKIKEATENAKALAEKNIMIYESLTQANIPIKMSIEEYKKLKEQVKSTMGSYIDLFSQTERKDVGQVATQLKAQFMAAGDSAEVATAKIFTMIKQSENANLAAIAIGSTAFKSISNMEAVSKETVNTFNKAVESGDGEAQARALHSVFDAMNGTLDETISAQQKLREEEKTTAEEVGKVVSDKLKKIEDTFGNQGLLTKEAREEISNTVPEIGAMINSTDTLESAWAKYRLLLNGVSMDFKNLSGEAAFAALQLSEIVKSQVQLSPAVVEANKKYKDMTTRIAELTKAQKGQSVKAQYNAKEESKRLQEQIAQIKKAAQDKIDGIRKATEAENTQLEIQKAQLRAQQQLIQGNMSAYAEEQMTIEQLMNEANRKDAEEAIIAKAEIDIKPLQDALDSIANKQEAAGKKAAFAGEQLGTLKTRAGEYNDALRDYTQNLNTTMNRYLTDINFADSKEYQAALAGLDELAKKLGIKTPAKDVVSELTNALKNGINAQNVNLYAEKVQEGQRRDYTNNLKNMTETIKRGGGDVTKIYDPNTQELTSQARTAIAKGDELMPGDVFIDSQGRPYEVTRKLGPGHGAKATGDRTVIPTPTMSAGKFMGGRIVPGIPYTLNDGGKVEGITFDAAGTVYPNINTMPKFNIPSGTKYNGIGGSTTSSSSNVYNIDIALNGTNVTADDVINRMKREMALINAKEGINRRVGA